MTLRESTHGLWVWLLMRGHTALVDGRWSASVLYELSGLVNPPLDVIGNEDELIGVTES